jgi:TPR repeat protein
MRLFDSILKSKISKLRAEGKEALVRRDRRRALQIFSELAEAGDAEGQCRLAFIYKSGLQDFEKAAFWYRKAAEQGHAEAQCKLGFLYRSGRGVARNDAEGARWYERAAALKWLSRAAEGGEEGAQYELGCLLVEGTLVPQDIPLGLRWLERAGSRAAAQAVTIGDFVAPSADRNRNAGVNALFTLGQIYRQGKGVSADVRKAFAFYLQAAKLGDAESQFITGVMLYKGDGTPKDIQGAAGWLIAAARQGHEGEA